MMLSSNSSIFLDIDRVYTSFCITKEQCQPLFHQIKSLKKNALSSVATGPLTDLQALIRNILY